MLTTVILTAFKVTKSRGNILNWNTGIIECCARSMSHLCCIAFFLTLECNELSRLREKAFNPFYISKPVGVMSIS